MINRLRLGNVLALGAIAVLASCETTRQVAREAKAFVPPPPAPVEPAASLGSPSIDGTHFVRERPPISSSASEKAHQQRLEAEMRLSRADELFRRGTERLSKNDIIGARTEFDRALDFLLSAPASVHGRDRLAGSFSRMVDEIYRLELESNPSNGQPAEPAFERSPLEEVARMTFPVEPSLKGKVKEQLQWTVSKLPLETADPVLSFINYFQSPAGNEVIRAGLRRAGRYAPMIRRILDEEGLPPELLFMAQAESVFLPRAVSYMQAVGMWQFVRDRGRQYGLHQTPYTDDRMDPERATRAAARHLRDLYTQFGDWYLAIAAYNCGPVAVERAVQRTGYADFWELYARNVLPRQTANYLPIILALTIMAKNPKDYGIDNVAPDPPIEYDTVEFPASTHLNLIADLLDRPLPVIRDLNPGILWLMAPPRHPVRVPKGSANRLLAALDLIPPEKRASWRVHRVTAGESLPTVARLYRIPEKSVVQANPTVSEPLAGDLIVVPLAYPGGEATGIKGKSGRGRGRIVAVRPAPAASSTSGRKGPRPTTKSGVRPERSSAAAASGPRTYARRGR
jgi:membrane-bound lytic murein transglycosylase D